MYCIHVALGLMSDAYERGIDSLGRVKLKYSYLFKKDSTPYSYLHGKLVKYGSKRSRF